jgi:hypothetical protein
MVSQAFLTVTFDDESSVLMQVWSQDIVDDDTEQSDLTDEDLVDRGIKRRYLRLKCPGYGSINFDQLVIEHVVGWNMRKNSSTESPGIFGKCLAVQLRLKTRAV